jgi:hypothetical protein
MSAQDERRKFTRLPKNYKVEIRELTFPLNKDWLSLKCVDISAGGLRLVTSCKFSPGQRLQVKIYIPGLNKFHPGFFKVFEDDVSQTLQAVAEVAWVKEIFFSGKSILADNDYPATDGCTWYELGLRFVDVYEDDWRALHNMIKRLLSC